MNYIKRLEQENRALTAELEGLREGIRDLRIYLDLPKFSSDSRVERGDIYLRLEDAENLASEAANRAVQVDIVQEAAVRAVEAAEADTLTKTKGRT